MIYVFTQNLPFKYTTQHSETTIHRDGYVNGTSQECIIKVQYPHD